MRKFLVCTIAVLSWPLLFVLPTQAAVLEKTIDRQYELKEGFVRVTETSTSSIIDSQYLIPAGSHEVFTVFNPIINDGQAKSKIDKTIPTIRVTDGSGKSLKFITDRDGQNLLIKVPRPSNIVAGRPQIITVVYDSYALSSRNGALVDMYVPSFSKNFQFTDNTTTRRYNTIVRIPKSFGQSNFVVPESQLKDRGNHWQINFSQKQLTGTISWIQMGTKQFYQFSIKQAYKPTTEIPLFFNTYQITLPREVVAGPITQELYFTKFEPQPTAVSTDSEHNVIASFRVPASQAGEIVIEGYATITQNKSIDLTKAGTLSQLDPQMIETYTKPSQYWESDANQIKQTAAQIKGNTQDVYKIVSDTYSFVVDKIDYSNVKRFGINERQGALKTLQGGAAVCMEYSDLFIALMRAQGIPARAAFGYGYDSRSTNGNQTAHQWAEVYLPGLDTWVGVDTTWGEAGPAIIGGDMNHFYKYVASLNPQTPAPVSLTYFGGVPNIEDEKFDIVAIKEIPEGVQYRTQEELLRDFPQEPSVLDSIARVGESIGFAARSVDSGLDKWFVENLGASSITSSILRLLLYIAPVLVTVGLGAYIKMRRQRAAMPGE